MSITGHCLCGQARYTIDGQPQTTGICHCRNCQRQSGSAFSILLAVPSGSLKTEGALKTFEDTADNGQTVDRVFCPECGSPLFSVMSGAPQTTYIKAGTLDDVSALAPQFHIWCNSAQPWVAIDSSLPCFDENPPLSG